MRAARRAARGRGRRRGRRGNLQAWARDVRYAAGGAARERGADIAAGHTATDQVETVLYRLASSPGRRALLGMAPRDGRLVRPLLALTREETAAYCRERGLPWVDDPSNATERFARTASAHELLPAAARDPPRRRANILRTLELLRDEADALDALRSMPPARVGDGARRWPRGSPATSGGWPARASARCGELALEHAAGSRWRSASSTGRAGVRTARRGATACSAPSDGLALDGAGRRCAPGGPATACAPLASAARSRCRTCSPTARSRASSARRCRSSTCGGEIAWVPGVAAASAFAAGARCAWPGAP